MKNIIYISLLLLLNSCYCTYDITIKKNGSAHIEIYDWDEYQDEKINESLGGEEFYSGFDNFKKSSIISNYNRSTQDGLYKVEYDINNVDSLRNYLLPINQEDKDSIQTTFKYTNDQFIITHTLEEDGPNEATMYGELIPLKVIFRFKKKIKTFSSDLDFVKQINNKEVEINTNLNEISYGKGTNKVIVTF